jgi:hypothetical protein
MWPFKRRKEKYDIIDHVVNVSMPILIRQVIYDSIFDSPDEIATMMGLAPTSDEVSEMEARASEERISQFSALLPFIDAHSDIAAQVACSAYSIEAGLVDSPVPGSDEALEELTRLFKLVSMSASVSCISTLMNLGLLETKVVSNDDE